MAKAALVDVSKCIGCKGCQVACKEWNELAAVETTNVGSYQNPLDLARQTWTIVRFKESQRDGRVIWNFLKYQCMHCTQASCVAVCPTGAAQKVGEIAIFDQNICMGCGYCVVACPFDVPRIAAEKNTTAQKCTFCIDRVEAGLTPACAKACPAGAIRFGDRDELIALGRQRVAELQRGASLAFPDANLYGEKELGGLGWLYVLPERPSFFGLPEKPVLATADLLGRWISGFVSTAVLASLPFWWVLKRRMAATTEGGEG